MSDSGVVAHYVERWLEVSAGFVASQISRSRHRGVVIARDGWVNLDAFGYRPRHSLHRLRDRAPERLKATALRAQLVPLLAAHRASLVHVHFGYAASDVLSVTGPRRPYVLSLHGHDVTGLLADSPHRYTEVAAAVDAVIVPSQFLAAKASAAGFDPSRITVIPSGVDTAFFRPTPLPGGPPNVGFVGRLVEKKGIDVLLAAWPMIRAEVPDAVLTVLGDGPEAGRLALADDSLTHLLPRAGRRHDQVREVISRSTVVVTPSRTGSDGDSESLLLVNLEAAASGRPVVSTDHGGIPEYVDDGVTGLLVAENDPARLAEAVIRVLRDAPLAARLAANGPVHAARWSVEQSAARVDECYDRLLARPGRK
jgi:glycosyltransferase involved in cell wall biosynthesis